MSSIKKTTANSNYDYVVVGAGLTGLSLASLLSQRGLRVALLDGSDVYGGNNRSVETRIGSFNNGLRFLPGTENSAKAIGILELLLETSLSAKNLDLPPVTFEEGSLRPFLGFGNQPPKFYDEINYFLCHSSIQTLVEPHEWSTLLFNRFTGDFFPNSHVTRFNCANGLVTSVLVNGQKTLTGAKFVFCGTPKTLQTLIADEFFSNRAKQRLNKSVGWTGVCLDILHGQFVSSEMALHLLNGTTQDDIGPCVGRFFPSCELDGKSVQYSQWLSFISAEDAEETELTGNLLKKMKRQIKRAYPNAFDGVISERISVAQDLAGTVDLKLNSNLSIPGLPNLFVVNGKMHTERNLVGMLLQVEKFLLENGQSLTADSHPVRGLAETDFVEDADSLMPSQQMPLIQSKDSEAI